MPPRHYEEITGEFDYVKRQYPASDGQIKMLPGMLIDGTQVVGYAGEDEMECGLTYLFMGYWAETKYGKQFNFHSFRPAQPSGKRGTIAYLQRGLGIGKKRAEVIWEKYGPGSLDAIRTKPEEVAAAVNGLTPDKARAAAAYFEAHVALEATTKDLLELLAGLGTPKKLIAKLIEKWGAKAGELVRENPYRLIAFGGVGYAKADRLFLQLGGNPATPERLAWRIWAALHKDRDGHTWRPVEFGKLAIEKGIAGVDASPQAGLDWAIEHGQVAMRRDENGRVWIAEREKAAAEMRLANHVHRAMVGGAAI